MCQVSRKLRIRLMEAAFWITPLVSWCQVFLQSQWCLVTMGEGSSELKSLDCPKRHSWVWLYCTQSNSCWPPGKKWAPGPLHVTFPPFRALLGFFFAPGPLTIWSYLVAHPAHTHWCPTPGVSETSLAPNVPATPWHLIFPTAPLAWLPICRRAEGGSAGMIMDLLSTEP